MIRRRTAFLVAISAHLPDVVVLALWCVIIAEPDYCIMAWERLTFRRPVL